MATHLQWQFGLFCLDPTSGCLWRDGALVPLRPKPFALLAYLVTHAGQVVTRAQLLEAVWPEVVVSEGVLKDYIKQIRKTLGDTPHRPQYIATSRHHDVASLQILLWIGHILSLAHVLISSLGAHLT